MRCFAYPAVEGWHGGMGEDNIEELPMLAATAVPSREGIPHLPS